jgi:hypothetical protein
MPGNLVKKLANLCLNSFRQEERVFEFLMCPAPSNQLGQAFCRHYVNVLLHDVS